MRVAFVSYDVYQGKSTGYYPPLYLCNLATALRNNDIEVKVFDYSASFSSIGNYFQEIKDFKPSIIGMTCRTPYVGTFFNISKKIREMIPSTVMVTGGSHPSVRPEWTLNSMPQFDYVMRGECDRSILDFVDMISGKKSEKDVLGLAYRKGKEVRANEREFIEDLNGLPQIDRTILDKYYKENLYWDMAAKGKVDIMMTSRGCPYNCIFCFKLEGKYRCRSAEHVMCEFDTLKKRGVRSIHIQDDNFTANQERCLDIANKLADEKYKFDIKIRSRVDTVSEKMLQRLKEAGVKQIVYGFESGSQKMLDAMNKRTTVEMNEEAVAMTKKVGIACYGEIMIGIPGETKETINETISFLLKAKPIIGFVPVLYPLPGTRVYDEAKKNKILIGDWDIKGNWPWIKLPWAKTADEIQKEAKRIEKTIQRDLGTIAYFIRCHLLNMNLKQFKFLIRRFIKHLSGYRKRSRDPFSLTYY